MKTKKLEKESTHCSLREDQIRGKRMGRPSASMKSLMILLCFMFSAVASFEGFVSACDKTPECLAKRMTSWRGQANSVSKRNSPLLTQLSSWGSRSDASSSQNNTIAQTEVHIFSPTEDTSYIDQIDEYRRRKSDWANRYTNLESLRQTFGSNKNWLWGDLDATSARRLYKTLLPKALLELVSAGVHPEDLAPLAYQARVAAKMYARERCRVPARLMATLFDGFRMLKKYGKFQPIGMSYEQVWAKYQEAVIEEYQARGDEELTDRDSAVRSICMRIVESSCRTNESIDRWILPDSAGQEEVDDLLKITQTLEKDVRKLLDPVTPPRTKDSRLRIYRTLRLLVRAKRSGWGQKGMQKK